MNDPYQNADSHGYKVTAMNEELQSVSGEIKKVDRRLETLARHLSQVEARKKHKAVYDKYKKLTGKKGDAFYDKHFEEIQAYEAANKYIKDVLNGRTKIPVGEWKQEQEKLNALRYSLAEKFYSLQDEIRATEIIKNGAERIIKEETQERATQKSVDIDL